MRLARGVRWWRRPVLVEDVEEDDERVLIHVGEHVWETGYGEGSPSAQLPAGYPFPT
jgi:hypothetical protein